MKKALVIGIDDYLTQPLSGCVNDAVSVASIIEKNGDGSPNFSVHIMTSNLGDITAVELNDRVAELFNAGGY